MIVPRRVLAAASAMAVVGVIAACKRADRDAASDASTPTARADDSTGAAPPAFGLYVLALSWAPSFCCSHPDKEECAGLPDAFAGTHLTLHGLWPNYTDAEARAASATYPQFCGAYERCQRGHDARCAPDPSTIPDEMRVLGPGYVGDHDFLADHEWPKHGSCTGLGPAAYFRAALDAMKALPGKGTPDALRNAVGGEIALVDLERAFGVPHESVLLGCDAQCRLEQASFCLAHDANGIPTTTTSCPANTTSAQYDNGCVTRGCQRVKVAQAGRCDAGGSPNRRPETHDDRGRACNHPGQGPPCTGNSDCTRAGYLRCARSGCCTSQP